MSAATADMKLDIPRPRYWTYQEMASIFRCTEECVRQRVLKGHLPAPTRLFGKHLFNVDAVMEVVRQAEAKAKDRVAARKAV